MDTKLATENNGKKISIQTVERLSLYRKILEELHEEGITHIYSHQLARQVGVTPAQLRRDLASFGSFGNISKGYNVYQMILTISRLLGTDRIQSAALIGMGNLGRAILSYRGFEERGFHIAVVFDMDTEKVGGFLPDGVVSTSIPWRRSSTIIRRRLPFWPAAPRGCKISLNVWESRRARDHKLCSQKAAAVQRDVH